MAIALQADGGGKASNAASDDEDAERLAFRFLHDNVETEGWFGGILDRTVVLLTKHPVVGKTWKGPRQSVE